MSTAAYLYIKKNLYCLGDADAQTDLGLGPLFSQTKMDCSNNCK